MGQIKMVQVGIGTLRTPNGMPLKTVKLYALEEDLQSTGLIPNTPARENAVKLDIANIFTSKFKAYKKAEAAAKRKNKSKKPIPLVLAEMTDEELDARFERRIKELTGVLTAENNRNKGD